MTETDRTVRTTPGDLTSALFSLRAQVLREARRESMRRPTGSSVRDSSSRRDPETVDRIVMGSADGFDVSSAILGTVVVYVPPEPGA